MSHVVIEVASELTEDEIRDITRQLAEAADNSGYFHVKAYHSPDNPGENAGVIIAEYVLNDPDGTTDDFGADGGFTVTP